MFQALQEQAPDILLQLIKLHKADPRPDKIDVGVGVYSDQLGTTPVFGAVKTSPWHMRNTRSFFIQNSLPQYGPVMFTFNL